MSDTTIDEHLRKMFPESSLRKLDLTSHTVGGGWATPCMCGHDSHGYSGHCTHMSCDDDDCDCGGYEPQPGMALPTVRVDGPHPLFAVLKR